MGRKKKEYRLPIFRNEISENELIEKAISGGAKTIEESQEEIRLMEEEQRQMEEETIAIGFQLQKSINDAIERDRKRRYRWISKTQWIKDAILTKLKIKDVKL